MKKYIGVGLLSIAYTIFALYAYRVEMMSGQRAVKSLAEFTAQMGLLIPFAFLLIGLFEVWVKKETVQRYLGHKTGFTAYLLAIALAGTTVGGLYIAFPFAYALHKKGAKLGVIFTYVSAAGIAKIPMTIFEISFLGPKFTLIRFALSLPLVLLTSWFMGRLLHNRNYVLVEPKAQKVKGQKKKMMPNNGV